MKEKETVLSIEFGSTRIKAVLLDRQHAILASGSFEWENQLINGIWTYSLDDVRTGLQTCYSNLKHDVLKKLGYSLRIVGAIGISGMMHGYLPFDRTGKQLAQFRTWRNTITSEAAEKLSALFCFNVPQRWSIAHLYQSILNKEPHVADIAQLTTLAGYIHFLLTGEKVVGICEASGMFPIDSDTLDYDETMLRAFDAIHGQPWKLRDILPKILTAGACGGYLTEEGAALLDPEGDLQPGILFAPCEGDAGTGMAATNAVRVHTGNVSAGTSDFAMLVSDHQIGIHPEIDMVVTPAGLPVAMVHCNNCTSDINAWVALFSEFSACIGADIDKNTLYTLLFQKALEGNADCGGLLSYNYLSGEHITELSEGCPVFLRKPESSFTLGNFMRTHLYSALATLKIGLDILIKEENIRVDTIYGHGGFFKTPIAGQKVLSAAIGAPVSVLDTAGEGGPYGMALLCAYFLWKEPGETLEDYLDKKVYANAKVSSVMADEADIRGFSDFVASYRKSLDVERAAVKTLR